MRPDHVWIFGKKYDIRYVDNPVEVDMNRRKALWGQIDYWTRTIRIYDNGRQDGDILQTLMHEIVHAIDEEFHLKIYDKMGEDVIDLLGSGIADVLLRNDWLK